MGFECEVLIETCMECEVLEDVLPIFGSGLYTVNRSRGLGFWRKQSHVGGPFETQ
jgi:hypothetical protein